MTIWDYADLSRGGVHLLRQNACPYCGEDLAVLLSGQTTENRPTASDYRGAVWDEESSQVSVCRICGWWKAMRTVGHFFDTITLSQKSSLQIYGAAGSLRELDLTDLSIPLEEVRCYLAARYEARFEIHPRLFEECVASVFRGIGYAALATAYSGDDGIDVVLSNGHSEVGVQVKRYKDLIKAEQIRSLAGALVLRGVTTGIFVTTSAFQKGAKRTAARYQNVGYRIELVDASRFLDQLRVAQRSMYQTSDEFFISHCFDRLEHVDGWIAYI